MFLARSLFVYAFLAALGLGAAAYAGALSTMLWALGAFAVCLVLSTFDRGDKTRLQMLFGTIGTALAFATPYYAFSGWCWVGVGVCGFLVATMKLDGGDGMGA